MRVVFIGQFPPPFDPVTLNNLSLVEKSQSLGVVCKIINLSREENEEPKKFPQLLWHVFTEALQSDALHFLTRAYDRKSVFFLFLISLMGKLLRRQTFLTIHPELFGFLGPLRSRHVGKPLFRLCFRLTDTVYCNGEGVAETVKELGCPAEKIVVNTLTISRPERTTAVPTLANYVENKKVVLALFVTSASSYLLKESQIFISSLREQYAEDFGLVVCSDDSSTLDQDVFSGDDVYRLDALTVENTTFVLSRATMVLRPLQCLGNVFMPDDAFILEWPTQKDEHTVEFSKGFAFIRKGGGLVGSRLIQPPMPLDESTEKSVAKIILQHKPQNALLLGTFSSLTHEESRWNENIRSKLESAGVACETISMTNAPFDNNRAASFFSFLKYLDKHIKNHDCVLYMTQGYTRPSLLLLLAIAIMGKLLRRKRVYVLFHRDLFSFFGRMRSRNAGLPLLFTSFSLVDGILASREGCEVAKQYVNAPDKFHVVRPMISEFQDNGEYLKSPQVTIPEIGNGILCGNLVRDLQNGHENGRNGRSLSTINGRSGMIEREKKQEHHANQPPRWIARPLQCNGEIIGGTTACLIESSVGYGSDSSYPSGAIVVRKGEAQMGDIIHILSVPEVMHVD